MPACVKMLTFRFEMQMQTPKSYVGFFNSIPGDTALLIGDDAADIGFNLVSSNWVDYKTFTLHRTVKELAPMVTTVDGSPIPCHGYISGTWTDFSASHQWSGLVFFVVDAVFSEIGSSQVHHFLLSPTALHHARQYHSEWL